MKVKWLWMWIGGSISRVAGTGLIIGLFILIYGATPGQAFADLLSHLPVWASNPWFRLSLVIIGLFLIAASLYFNVWSLRQVAIDQLAEDLSWAISNLLNSVVKHDAQVAEWEIKYREWCNGVSKKLENRAFFTRADQLHFDMLGIVPPANFTRSFNAHHEWLVSQLKLKFERLRDIINWSQMRKR
ncbi:MAG: hypothetical protein ACOZBW_07115 [Thermodesulfobacteriota bacterium]